MRNTPFGKEVRKAMIDKDWSMSDLAEAVGEKTGKYCDQAYISRILSGQRNPPKIIKAIREVLEIEEGGGWEK